MHSSEVKADLDNVVPPGWKSGPHTETKDFTHKIGKKLPFLEKGCEESRRTSGLLGGYIG